MEKKRLYFDMDGVIVDFNSAIKLQRSDWDSVLEYLLKYREQEVSSIL